jgi:hypothetical protein
VSSRRVAFIEWGVGAVIVLWMIVFYVATQLLVTLTLGIVITSVPVALGLLLSLGVNGGIHFKARPLRKVEIGFLIAEAVLLALLVVASIADQLEYERIANAMFSSLGHWLDWFMPLWLLLGPVAIVVFILALVGRSATSSSAR